MVKENLCPSFYCSNCKVDHSGECPPKAETNIEKIKRLMDEALSSSTNSWKVPIVLVPDLNVTDYDDDPTVVLTPDGYRYSGIGTIRNPPPVDTNPCVDAEAALDKAVADLEAYEEDYIFGDDDDD